MVNAVRTLIISSTVVMLLTSGVRAQTIFGHDSTSTRTERIEYVVGASLVFSLLDYVGFNEMKKSHGGGSFEVPSLYRIAQGIVQGAITYFLYKQCGLNSAISFNLIWWTWGDDFAYYGWGYLTGLYPWESRSESGFRFSEYNSAGWTPVGMLRPQGSWIAKSTLIAQATIGFSISMAMLW